jgi:FtsP/CotA-like multicopper oxidase with cupredoxin domain
MRKLLTLLALSILAIRPAAFAQEDTCPDRPTSGDTVTEPVRLESVNGTLSVDLAVRNSVDEFGISHTCYVLADGSEAPTLVASPGDRVVLNVTNHLTATAGAPMPMEHAHGHGPSSDPCDGGRMASDTTNVHFHGLNIPPKCHQDETIRTTIQPEQTFQYAFRIPPNEPPGLYWYHPHMHGFTTAQITGGAAGALIVRGIEQVRPEAAGLPERVFVIRQFSVQPPPPGVPPEDPDDDAVLSINFVPAFAKVTPPVITMKPGERQLWRVLNATSIHFLALQFQVDLAPRTVELVASDGVPLATSRFLDTVVLPPAGRAEFIVEGPGEGSTAKLISLAFDTGPDGDYNPYAVVASVVPEASAAKAATALPAFTKKAEVRRFAGLEGQRPTKKRKLFFSETTDDSGNTQFFLTVEGQTPKVFEMSDPPAVTTKEGAVEDWVVENRSTEVHAFHIHQIHFLVLAENGVPVANHDVLDTIVVPYWDGTSSTYPSVTLRMDFRDPETAGTFLYHCHILDHGDGGMMAKIEVKARRK